MAKLTCAFGSRWTARGCGPCRKCRAYADRLDREFAMKVLLGEYDARGYTPRERKARQAKQQAAKGKAA